ncbi:AmmeMemoRadiSam system protein B [Patescibacteria group bacterium]
MKDWNKIRLIGVVLVFLLGACSLQFFLGEDRHEEALVNKDELSEFVGERRECRFFDEQLFFLGDEYARKQEINKKKVIRGGVVPHHLLPSYIINDFFYRLSFQNVKTIVIVGPNHDEIGNESVVTSDVSWNDYFGEVFPDQVIIKKLEGKGISVDNSFIEKEHSISGLIPFLNYYLPETKIVPLIVRQKINKEEMNNVVNLLGEIIKDQEAVIVASVDFSHYLTSSEAQEKNRETRVALENRDCEQLLAWSNNHLDSPQSISILLKVMEGIGANKMNILHDTDSGQLTGDYLSETTSYFGITFE